MTSAQNDDPFQVAERAASALAEATGIARHDAAVVLGSGWGDAAAGLGTLRAEIAMATVPGFPAPSVGGHKGTISSLAVGDGAVLVLAGRSHFYEGHPVATVVHGVRTAIAAGCRVVVLTNAAGSLNPALGVGTPVLLADHLNLTGASPMAGPFPADRGSRFVDLTDAYSPRLRALARAVDPSLAEGVYAGLLGGAYETPAEIRMLRLLGADLVGMSTVLETIAARHLGAEVLGISLVTNLAAGLSAEGLDHHEVLAAGRDAGPRMVALLRGVLEGLDA
jgi:purine-nucleoside phosphorylase